MYITPIDPAELSTRFSTEDTLDPIHNVNEDWVLPRLDKIKAVLDRLPDREADMIRLYFFLDKKQMDIAEIFNITQAAVSYRIKRALKRIRFLVEMPEITKDELQDLMNEIMTSSLNANIFTEIYFTTCQSEVASRLNVTQGRVRHRYIKNLRFLGETVLDRILSWVDTLDPETFYYSEFKELFHEIERHLPNLKDEEFENVMKNAFEELKDIDADLGQKDLMHLISIYEVYVRLRYNFNILREVRLPKWSNRATNTIW